MANVMTCPKCGQKNVAVRQKPWQNREYLASHNTPPNEDGFIARCGNRYPKKGEANDKG